MKINTFDHIAGCSLGTWSDRDTALACLDFIRSINNAPEFSYSCHPLSDEQLMSVYRNLAADTDDIIDLDYYSDLVINGVTDSTVLSPYTAICWEDNELRVLPCIESAIEDCTNEGAIGGELPDDNPDKHEYFLTTTDHGNCSLYQWNPGNLQWDEIWSVV